MDVFCNDITNSLDVPHSNDGEVNIFCAWVKTWDNKKLGLTVYPILEARLVSKYVGLKWLYPDNNYNNRFAHPNNTPFKN